MLARGVQKFGQSHRYRATAARRALPADPPGRMAHCRRSALLCDSSFRLSRTRRSAGTHRGVRWLPRRCREASGPDMSEAGEEVCSMRKLLFLGLAAAAASALLAAATALATE